MKRRVLLGQIAGSLLFALPALGDGLTDQIARQLQDQGYTRITVQQTMLGRTRILATSSQLRREIIVNPRTGEILRDFWQTVSGDEDDGGRPSLIDPGNGSGKNSGSGKGSGGKGGSGQGSDGDDDDDDDEDEDEDDDGDDRDDHDDHGGGDDGDDNSGPGSDNSGPGGGNDGGDNSGPGGGGDDDNDDDDD